MSSNNTITSLATTPLCGDLIVGVGILGMVMILIFEFSLEAAPGYSRERILSDYNMAAGKFMALGMLFMLFVPVLVLKARAFAQHPIESYVKGHLS